MKKKLLSMLLSTVLILSAMGISVPMAAMADTMMVVTVGADLTQEQKNMILNYFNVAGQSYTTITVTNNDEWAHLGSYMSRDIVGYKTISCALIRPMTSGGIQVKTANLTYVTSNMIASNLATAGVTNCEVLAAAPFQVSGTGALTGALMAYENLSGVTLDAAKKEAAAQEFATTYELGQTIGQQEAQQIVNDVKMQVINGTLEEDNSITQEEINEIVNNVVNNYTTNNTTNTTNVTNTTTGLDSSQIAALQNLAVEIAKESYEQGTLDALAQIQKTLEGQTKTSSTDATTKIEENAASTAEATTTDTTTTDTTTDTTTTDTVSSADTQSAADQALAQDSLLLNTDESALAGTTTDGSVISSSTAEKSIDTTVATNLDTQIEEQQQEEAQTDATGIPEATDSTTLGGENTTTDTTAEGTTDATAEGTTDATAEGTTDATAEGTTDATAEGTTDATVEGTTDATDPAVTTDAQSAISITNNELINQTATLASCSTTADGTQQASGAAPVELTVPYENLTPVTAGLRITNPDGSDAATFTYDAAKNNMVLLTNAEDSDIPAGSTKIIMMPADCNDISGATNFAPVAGQTYNYNVNAEFTCADGNTLNVQITEYAPYQSAVSDKGFSPDSYSLTKSYMEGASGTVLFPADGSATYATVSADAQSQAMVTSSNAETPNAVTKDAGEIVTITPIQKGLVTLTITYFASAEAAADPAAAVGTVEYTMYFAE